ncbi:MAG: ABC transporter substrate binding protein, partial [bacterium]
RNYVPPSRQYYAFERIYSNIKAIAFVHRKGEPNSVIQFNEFRKILEPRGIKVIDIAAVDLDDMRAKLKEVIHLVDAVYSACDTLIQSGGEELVIHLCRAYIKPVFSCNKDGVLKGALIGNVADFYTIGSISGEKASLILQGAEPAWLKTESPREDYIIVNRKTADELNIIIPEEIRIASQEIIGQ